MLRLLLSTAIGALLSLPVAEAVALGFGRVGNATALGQPLAFVVGVRLDADDNLSADCVSVEVFSGDNRLASSALHVSVEPGSEPSERNVRIVSSAPIDEPVVSVNLQIACPNRLTRKFVVFIDPPAVNLAQAPWAAVAAVAQPMARNENVAAPDVAAPAGAPQAPLAAGPAPRSRHAAPAAANKPVASTTAVAGGAPARSQRARRAETKSARAPAAASGARLELEAADDAATRERLALQLTSTLVAAPAVAASAATADQPPSDPDAEAARQALERERMQALEASLTKLRAESQATQASLAELRARLREAEAERYANPLVLALAALATALAATVGVLLWMRGAERRAAKQWWAQPELAAARAEQLDRDADTADAGRATGPDRRIASAEAVAVAETTASPMMLTQVHAAAQAAPPVAALPAAEPEREMSVEELIDLEQQAEFFVVLGQEEAAIDLLMGHLRSSGGASPLPYLKLLDIFRRRDDREAFERIRDRFNRRFNAYAPDWQADPRQGRTLLDHPNVIARLEALWATPKQAMQAIDASLFRRDTAGAPFDLPAYRELLFLYAVARDLSEREAPPAIVDLLLPIGDEATGPQPPLHRRAAPAAAVALERQACVDVDITRLDAGPASGDERPSRFHTDFGPTSGGMTLAVEPRVVQHA